jgi:hypothetical protein
MRIEPSHRFWILSITRSNLLKDDWVSFSTADLVTMQAMNNLRFVLWSHVAQLPIVTKFEPMIAHESLANLHQC